MYVGIIVYSKTGNTLSVVKRLKQSFEEKGHTVSIDQISADVDEKSGKVTLSHKPDPTIYDRVVFASPVWAFSLCSVMKEYLSGLPHLGGMGVYGIVTQQLAYPWIGGNRAIKKIRRLCTDAGGQIIGEGIIMWSKAERDRLIDELAKRLSSI